jgi:hypothetical protein
MPTAFALAGGKANFRTAPTGPARPRGGATLHAIKKVFPEHARKVIGRFLNLSEGGAKKKIEGDREFTADELAALLRTEHGFRLLTEIMVNARPKWWVLCSAFMRVRSAEKMQAQARDEIKSAMQDALDADATLAATISHADALLVHDENFMRPHVDALRTMGGVQNRPVVKASKEGP